MILRLREHPKLRRWGVLGLAVLALLVMGFYAVTDVSHLTHSYTLNGADWMGYAVCHRITERSFTVNGRQFPLCARCTGMYLGAALVLVIIFLSGRSRWANLPSMKIMIVLIGFIGLMGIDGVNSYSHFFPNAPHLYEPRNWLRLLTGMGTGLTMGIFMFPALAQTLWQQPIWLSPVETFRELGGYVGVALVLVLVLLSNQPAIMYVLAIISTLGLLALLMAINVVIFLILLKKDGRAVQWRETAVPLVIGLLLAIAELSAISLLRWNLTGTMAGLPGLP